MDPILSPPGWGSGKSSQGPQGSSCCNPHFTPLSSLGPDCFTPSPGNSQARQAGRHFLKSPRGGTGRGGGGARGRGQDPAGGDGDGVGVGTSWKTRPRAAQQFAKSGLSGAWLRVRPGGAGARGPQAAAWWTARDMPRTPRRTPRWLLWLPLLRTLRLDRPTP